MATGPSPRLAGGGAVPGVSRPDAHIRAQEGVGPALSPGQKPEAGSWSICQVPGRARAPERLVPTSPSLRPRGPPGCLAWPHPVAMGLRVARSGPARPSLAGPRLPAGQGRTSPLARQGAEGAGQCLQASLAPGRAGMAALSHGRGIHPFCQEIWGPSPQTLLGAGVPTPSLMWARIPSPVLVWRLGSTIQTTWEGCPSLPRVSLSPEGI